MFRPHSSLSLALLAGSLLAACTPAADSGSDVIVLAYQADLGRYDRKVVRLETADDLIALNGSVAEVLGNAEFKIDEKMTSFDDLIVKKGSSVKLDLKDIDGVLVPADFHSLNMVTAYYNFEKASLFFKDLGVNPNLFGKRKLYYFPKLTIAGEELKDNAMYVSALGGFAVLPFDELQTLPLAINMGVMGHEYTHAVIDYLVTGADPYSGINSPAFSSNEAVNVFSSLHEGLADFMGAAIACDGDYKHCDPRFMDMSLPSELSSDRDLSKVHCLSSAAQAGFNQDVNQFSQAGLNYEVGTVLASSLWRALSASDIGHTEENWLTLATGIYIALQADSSYGIMGLVKQEIAEGNQGGFIKSDASHLTLKNALNAIVEGIKDNSRLKKAVCNVFYDRFRLPNKALSQCPSGTEPLTECSSKATGGDL